MLKTLVVALTLISIDAIAATTEQRISAIEHEMIPILVIKGENVPVATLAERMEQLKVPAVSVAVFNNGQFEWTRTYGYADKERRIPATPETLFEAGSISKAVTAVAALRLVESGVLDLDANVNDRLRSWRLPDNEFTTSHKVTLRTILNHTAGTTVSGFGGYARTDRIPSPVEVLEGKGNTEAIRVWKEPGQSWSYSGGGYTIVQVLMTDVTGRSFPALMHDTVLKPLGMRSSTYEQPLPDIRQARAASGYNREGVKVAGGWHVYPEMAAAGLWTTPTDLASFALAVERMYRGDGGVLSSNMSHMMLTPGMNDDGLGVFLTPDHKRFGHGGDDDGFQADMTAFIEGGKGLVIMTNSDNGGQLMQELELTIARQFGWSGFSQIEKNVIRLAPADLARLLGHYKLDAGGVGEFDLVSHDGRVFLKSIEMPEREILAESPGKFFVRDDLTPIELVMENGSTALHIEDGMHAMKISVAQ
jgi:CubicO group peptidase (beta-lactamase class C family)